MRLGPEILGIRGGIVLGVSVLASVGLAVHGANSKAGASLAGASIGAKGSPTGGTSTTKSAVGRSTGPAKPSTSGSSTTSPTQAVKLGPLLSSTQYAGFAYKIYPGTLSSKAKLATTGFSVKVTQSGANEVISVGVSGSPSPPQTSTFQKGDSVYFVEAAFGDDSGNSDYSAGDDGIVVTNPQGRIVE